MRECAACGWDGTLTRLTCPGCGEEKFYCSDCNASGRAFNCGDCQAHAAEQEYTIKCMVCGEPHKVFGLQGTEGVSLTCGECEERFSGMFVGHGIILYQTLPIQVIRAAAHETAHDSEQLADWNWADVQKYLVPATGDVICECPRQERRYGTEQHKFDGENPEDDDF